LKDYSEADNIMATELSELNVTFTIFRQARPFFFRNEQNVSCKENFAIQERVGSRQMTYNVAKGYKINIPI